MIRAVSLVALLTLSGCVSAPILVGVGGVLTGIAGLTNADVSAAEAYVAWRKTQATATPAPSAAPAPAP